MTELDEFLEKLRKMASVYDNINIEEMRQAHAAIAAKAVEDDRYLPLFEKIDAHVANMETLEEHLSPIERARLKLKARKG
jgi:hypothetical protein